MKNIVWLFSFWPAVLLGQISIDFEDNSLEMWEQHPGNRWETDSVNSLSGKYSLHHGYDNTQPGEDRLSFPTGVINVSQPVTWEFVIRHGYLPSASNRWTVFLMANLSAGKFFDHGFHAFAIGVNNGTTDDTLRVYEVKDNKVSTVLTCLFNWEKDAGTYPFCVRVEMNSGGLKVFLGRQGDELIPAGFAEKKIDIPESVRFRYFGISYAYTATKDMLLWFDDLIICTDIITDTIPPVAEKAGFISNRCVEIIFSEPPDKRFTGIKNFFIGPGHIRIDSISLDHNRVLLFVDTPLIHGQDYIVYCLNIMDEEGNELEKDSAVFHYYEALPHDVLITEIMADPLPQVTLPEYEYIELFNRSGYELSLEGWTLESGNKICGLSGNISPGSFLIITNIETSGSFAMYGDVLGIFSSFAVLANAGQTLVLKDRYGTIIDAVEYSDKWYENDHKAQGGWSLERIDINNFCEGRHNWTASISDEGGTPGRINSVAASNPDIILPFVSGVQVLSERELYLVFSESLHRSFFQGKIPFSVNSSKNSIIKIFPSEPFYNSCRMELMYPMIKGYIYELSINDGFMDCAGNKALQPCLVRFGLTENIGFTDIIITEVLYSPFQGCAEFIEIFNISEKILDISELTVGVNYHDGKDVKRELISGLRYIIFPGDYLVISKDPESLKDFYDIRFPARLFSVPYLPVLRDDGGCIELTNRSLKLIDKYCYSIKDHYPLLNTDRGVSLERMNINRKPGYESYWHSASSTAGFATPGYENSQSLQTVISDLVLSIEPRTVTPDNDGRDDFAVITYTMQEEGYTGNILIFDASGRRVKHLARNELLGFRGSFIWDGKNERGELCRTGIYLIYFDAFNLRGKKIRKKGTVLIVRTL